MGWQCIEIRRGGFAVLQSTYHDLISRSVVIAVSLCFFDVFTIPVECSLLIIGDTPEVCTILFCFTPKRLIQSLGFFKSCKSPRECLSSRLSVFVPLYGSSGGQGKVPLRICSTAWG